ncbi:hypothetical protein M9H77_35867 [Catharanthus roseus]|uniref:Uncharacterized protein n=1 Tax=Catharanthus roseus TaxID=4058 RepID=A0ACB9ZUG0_CATRO|nr:hypothetical protein M9H77_35867 [Catharanthus roseus]
MKKVRSMVLDSDGDRISINGYKKLAAQKSRNLRLHSTVTGDGKILKEEDVKSETKPIRKKGNPPNSDQKFEAAGPPLVDNQFTTPIQSQLLHRSSRELRPRADFGGKRIPRRPREPRPRSFNSSPKSREES